MILIFYFRKVKIILHKYLTNSNYYYNLIKEHNNVIEHMYSIILKNMRVLAAIVFRSLVLM